MLTLPAVAEPLLSRFSVGFTKPTFRRAMVLFVGFVLTVGPKTTTHLLAALQPLWTGHFTDYHRVLSRARFLNWQLARVLAAAILEVNGQRTVILSVDDHAERHKGDHVYGKGRHRDACRSTRSFTAWVWGHRWVVLAIQVKFSFATRAWALPMLVALYRTRRTNEQEGHRHRTPIELARPLVARLMRWFPEHRFILLGDGGYASHGMAAFVHRHRRQLTLVSLLHPRAHLCEGPPPPKKGQMGRRRIRGAKLPHPQDVVAAAKRRKHLSVRWYGGGRRKVSVVTAAGQWYKATEGLVPVRWVHVRDLEGDGEDRYFYCTDPTMKPARIIELYTARWSIEVTFQELHRHLGFGTWRVRSKSSVLRAAPLAFGIFSVVSVLFHRITVAGGKKPQPRRYPWYAKTEVTFSDAIAEVRRLIWRETVFSQELEHVALKKVKADVLKILADHLALAA